MGTTLIAQFNTRREAEMTIERLVQEHGIDRSDIVVAATGEDNTAGEEVAGSDTEAGEPSPEGRHDAALNGAIEVSVDLAEADQADIVRRAFAEFKAHDVEETRP